MYSNPFFEGLSESDCCRIPGTLVVQLTAHLRITSSAQGPEQSGMSAGEEIHAENECTIPIPSLSERMVDLPVQSPRRRLTHTTTINRGVTAAASFKRVPIRRRLGTPCANVVPENDFDINFWIALCVCHERERWHHICHQLVSEAVVGPAVTGR